jgi:hypothetical protein
MTPHRDSARGAVATVSLALSLCFCAGAGTSCASAPAPWPSATAQSWARLSAELSEQRQAQPKAPWSAGLRITMREPSSGRVIDGRGAIAVKPGQAVRMILTGAAGATMLDAWVTFTRWRVAVPPLALIRRGDLVAPRDMPVGFLRWWFLAPLAGGLFAATSTREGPLWLLRYAGAVIELREEPCPRGTLLRATRRVEGRGEAVDECRARPAPSAGDTARYVDESSGLRVDVQLESIGTEPPRDEAFEDPDALPRDPDAPGGRT